MDASKRLIPYSVHLTPEIYDKLKELAKERKASKMVRDAITMIISGKDEFTSGYNKALRDVIEMVDDEQDLNRIAINGSTIAETLVEQLETLML
jgi:predicted DNA-binding protein